MFSWLFRIASADRALKWGKEVLPPGEPAFVWTPIPLVV